MDDTRIRCPCNQKKCQNMKFLDVPTVKYHLARYGFVPDYHVWRFQGESNVRSNVERNVGGPDGGAKRQQIYGQGTHATGASSSATSHIDLDTIRRELREEKRAEMQAEVERMRLEMDQQTTEIEEKMHADKADMAQLHRTMAELRREGQLLLNDLVGPHCGVSGPGSHS